MGTILHGGVFVHGGMGLWHHLHFSDCRDDSSGLRVQRLQAHQPKSSQTSPRLDCDSPRRSVAVSGCVGLMVYIDEA